MIPDGRFRPVMIDDNTLQILEDSIHIPLKAIGCNLDAKGVLSVWDELESNGFPLPYICRLLVACEIKDRDEGNFYLLPMPIHLISILDKIQCVKTIDGGNARINKLKKELCSLASVAIKGPFEDRKKANVQILKIILSYCDEFQIGCSLHDLHPALEFNQSEGPDFKLEELRITIEAKSKLNRSHLGHITDPTITLDEITCLKLISKDAFESGSLERAFEDQGTDIAVMNMSHSQFGMLLAAHAYGLDNINFGLVEAFERAITMARSGKKEVLLYSEQVSLEVPYSICAIVGDKERVENYGSELDKIEKDLKIDTDTTEGFHKLIEFARKLN